MCSIMLEGSENIDSKIDAIPESRVDEMVQILLKQKAEGQLEKQEPLSVGGKVAKRLVRVMAGKGWIEELYGMRVKLQFPAPFSDKNLVEMFRALHIGFTSSERFYTTTDDDPASVGMVNKLNDSPGHIGYRNHIERFIEGATQSFTRPPDQEYDVDTQTLILTGNIEPSRRGVHVICTLLDLFEGKAKVEVV